MAGGIGRFRRQHVVVAGDEADLDIGERLGGRERAHERVHAVLALEAGEPEVRDDEPLRRPGAVVLLGRRGALRPRDHDVDAGLELADGLGDREGRDHVAIELGLRLERSGPDLPALLGRDGLGRGAVDLAEELLGAHRRQEVAVADAVDLDLGAGGVDRDERDALLAGARQDVVAAGEANLRRAVADIDLVVRRLQKALADRRRQALAEHEGVALAVLQAVDAELRVLGRDRGVRRAGHRNEGSEVDAPLGQRLREVEAHPRRGGIRVDLVVGDAEAALLAQLLIGLAQGRLVGELKACRIGVERRPPVLAHDVEIAEEGERLGLGRACRRALIGDVGGGRTALPELVALRVILGRDRLDGLDEADPVGGVLRLERDRGGVEAHRPALVRAAHEPLGVAPQLRRRPAGGGRAGLGLQLLLEAHPFAREIVAHEALLGESGGGAEKGRGDGRGAREGLEHLVFLVGFSPVGERGQPRVRCAGARTGAYHSAPAPQRARLDSTRAVCHSPGGGSGHENDATGIGGGALPRGSPRQRSAPALRPRRQDRRRHRRRRRPTPPTRRRG